jgi:hypothetical protein
VRLENLFWFCRHASYTAKLLGRLSRDMITCYDVVSWYNTSVKNQEESLYRFAELQEWLPRSPWSDLCSYNFLQAALHARGEVAPQLSSCSIQASRSFMYLISQSAPPFLLPPFSWHVLVWCHLPGSRILTKGTRDRSTHTGAGSNTSANRIWISSFFSDALVFLSWQQFMIYYVKMPTSADSCSQLTEIPMGPMGEMKLCTNLKLLLKRRSGKRDSCLQWFGAVSILQN